MRALADLDVLIVDCQTTGASPAFGCVLELGWGVARASRDELVDAQAHWIELASEPENPRLNALRLAKKLLLSAPSKEDSKAEKPEGWDTERVARHVERSAATAYQTYRRARWLRLLHDCDISYREPEAATALTLQIRGGMLLRSAADLVPDEQASAQFDRAKYDRLRVLTSELKRIVRDGGQVSVRLAGGRPIPERLLWGVLRLV